ncbi:MAG: AMP-binding protein [Hyphomicrobiales bacterium]|nr:AMP-binding protein [Hyphomicrobiales bacterium]
MSDVIHHGPTVGAQVIRALARYPDRIAFVSDGRSITYGAALDFVGRAQAVFASQGLGRGDRLAILTANRADAWCVGAAAQASAMSITWLHPLGSLEDQVEQIVDGECTAVLIDADSFLVRGGEIFARTPDLKHVFTLGRAEYGVNLLAVCENVGASRALDVARPDDIAILNYTGGTTGKSKGALRNHAQNAGYSTAILADFELPMAPRYLVIAPMSHVAGTKILPTLMQGGTVYLMKGFDPAATLSTIAREKINFTLLVPTMIYVLLDHPDLERTDLSSLELLLYGASPMSPTRLIEGLERIGPVFSQLYGQTECYPISVLRKADHDKARPELFASCGFPISSVAVRILDDKDEEVAPGEAGEICVRAGHAVGSYWKRPEQTAELFRSGWLHTGDIARMDERGYMYILDRKKDMIVSGGFNIYPRDVEDALSTHPGVAAAAVVGAPDPKWGEAVVAMVVARPGARLHAEELTQLVKARKGAAHAPKRVEIVEALPMTAVGKVDKKALRAKLWEGQARQVG